MIPKFRVWDTHEEVMNRVDYIDFANGIVGLSNENVRDYEQPIHRVKFMQSTNLLDKNGVEIYEGDILTLKYPRDRRYTVAAKVIRGSKISAMTLKFEDEFTTEEIPLYKISAEHNLEVMGNIYENPELLEEQNK